MMSVGGLKAAAKRTAFGDVSNTVKNLSSTHDDSAIAGKSAPQDFVKPVVPQENSAAFLRPAHRPLNAAGSKGPANAQLVPVLPDAVSKASQPQQLAEASKRTLLKRGTTIYKDTSETDQPPQTATERQDTAPTAHVHQSLGPRQHKSQPQLKAEQPVLRRTQSKILTVEPLVNATTGDTIYQDAIEEQIPSPPKDSYEAYMKLMVENRDERAPEVSQATENAVERPHRQLSAAPVASEPEEYWEEEEEEEIYDEQGYTTAHSYRSRGDNTTGGATTVLLPKVTNKVKKELAAAKEIVERSRTREEIDDEAWDTSMVAEYGDEIFAYMRELEVSSL
jgi:G2/mitotic-specific cyclin 3/4